MYVKAKTVNTTGHEGETVDVVKQPLLERGNIRLNTLFNLKGSVKRSFAYII